MIGFEQTLHTFVFFSLLCLTGLEKISVLVSLLPMSVLILWLFVMIPLLFRSPSLEWLLKCALVGLLLVSFARFLALLFSFKGFRWSLLGSFCKGGMNIFISFLEGEE